MALRKNFGLAGICQILIPRVGGASQRGGAVSGCATWVRAGYELGTNWIKTGHEFVKLSTVVLSRAGQYFLKGWVLWYRATRVLQSLHTTVPTLSGHTALPYSLPQYFTSQRPVSWATFIGCSGRPPAGRTATAFALWSDVLLEAVLFLQDGLLLESGPFHLDFGVPLGQKEAIPKPHVVYVPRIKT